MIHIDTFYAVNAEEKSRELNLISGRIISIQHLHDDLYEVIYESEA